MQLEWNPTSLKFLLTATKNKEMTYQIFSEVSGTAMVVFWTTNSSGKAYRQSPRGEADFQETNKAHSLNTSTTLFWVLKIW